MQVFQDYLFSTQNCSKPKFSPPLSMEMYAFKDPFQYAYIILSHLVLLLEYSTEVSEVFQNVITF